MNCQITSGLKRSKKDASNVCLNIDNDTSNYISEDMKLLSSKLRICLFSFLGLIAFASCQTTKAPTSDELLQNFKDGLALSMTLIKEETETYAGSYFSDYSCRCRVFLFRAESLETLNRHTDNPIFSAKQVEYSLKEL